MPIYGSPYGNSAKTKRTGFYDSGSGGGSVVSTAPPAPPTSGPQTDPFNGPGSIDFDLTDPQTAVEKANAETGNVFTGLKSFLFGTDQPDAAGHHGGLLGVGDVPLVGDVLRGGAEVATNVALAPVAGLAGNVVNAAGGALEHIPVVQPGSDEYKAMVDQFNALPDDSPAKQEALKAMADEHGLLGTGILSAAGHYMAVALQKAEEEKANPTPDLWNGLFRSSASLSDAVTNLFGLLGAGARGTERLVAGAGRPGADGMNQLDMVMAVGRGHAVWNSDSKGLTPVEQLVFTKYDSGEWTETQALDFLASHGAGYTHNRALEIAGSVFLDPLTVGSLGAGALAKLGKVGVALVGILKDSSAELAAARALDVGGTLNAADKAANLERIAGLEKAVENAQSGIRAGMRAENIPARDILGQLAKSKVSGDIARKYGAAYAAMADTSVGRIAKVTRTIIDPLHTWGETPRASAAIEEGSHQITHAVVSIHGEFTHKDNIMSLARMPGGEDALKQYEQGLAIYAGNALRRVAGRAYRVAQFAKWESLIETLPGQALRDALSNVRKRTLTQLEEEVNRYRIHVWDDAGRENLAQRAATLWGGHTKEEWLAEFSKPEWNADRLSLVHSATYGSAVRQLHDARAAVVRGAQEGLFTDRLHELVLLNRQSLTDLGAEGIFTRLEEAVDLDAKMAVIEQSKHDYPELRNFVSDPTSQSTTIDEFMQFLERKKNFLPAQIRDHERAQLPEALREFDARITDPGNAENSVYTIGFRPKDEFLWGLERGPDGSLRQVGDAWFDQVSDNLQGYMPVRPSSYNVAGKPIVGSVIAKGSQMLDSLEAAGRTMSHGVTGSMVSTSARTKFVANVTAKYEHAGLTRTQSEAIWTALMKKVDDSENISGIRGLSRDAIWNGAKDVIPEWAERAGLDRRALLVHILEAYDGDLRHIGLTQKFTGKAKLFAVNATGANTAGTIAEHAWPLLKFRLNPFFQMQEKIEPWVLNAQRGAMIAKGTRMNETDKALAATYREFVNHNLINMADNEISELARKMGWGKGMEEASRAEGGKMSFIRGKLESLTEVQGVKQLNMLRTYRKGLGKEMRAVYDEHLPGEFDKMLAHERAITGTLIDEDEFAVRLTSSNLAANRVLVRRMANGMGDFSGWEAEFGNAIKEGRWAAPGHLGELQTLEMDHMAARLALRGRNGADITTANGLREGLSSGHITMDDIMRGLRDVSAHPDYQARFKSALTFSYSKFWGDVKTTYGLTDSQVRGFESMYAQLAAARGMKPAEYLSQVYSPTILRGQDAAVGSLGALVEMTRAGRLENLPDLAVLRGVEGQSSIQDLYRQMSKVMSAHLDPSAKRAFLSELLDDPDSLPTELADIEDVWIASGADDALGDRIMGFVQGRPGTGVSTLVADETEGVAKMRDGAMAWRDRMGRPRNLQRARYDDSQVLGEQTATDFTGMHEPRARTAEEMNADIDQTYAEQVAQSSSALLKSDVSRAIGDTAAAAHRARSLEARKLYQYLTNEMGIEVKTVDKAQPYANAAALRADLTRGRIKVPLRGYAHPLYINEDAFIQNVVDTAFGYGQEGVEFGSHDGMMSAAAMYSDEGRGAYLSDTFASQQWERHSLDVIPENVQLPSNLPEYEQRWGRLLPYQHEELDTSGASYRPATRTVGAELRAAPVDLQDEVLTALGGIRDEFPDVPFSTINIQDLTGRNAGAVTITYGDKPPTMALNSGGQFHPDPVMRVIKRDQQRAGNEASRISPNPKHPVAAPGVARLVDSDPEATIWHEWGHVLDGYLHRLGAAVHGEFHGSGRAAANQYATQALRDVINDYHSNNLRAHLSSYAMESREGKQGHIPGEPMTDAEAFAELTALAFAPVNQEFLHGLEARGGNFIHPELQDVAMRFREALKEEGVWVPGGRPVVPNPNAGKTVAEVNRAAPGTVRAPSHVGLLPQQTLTDLTGHFIGSGRYAESNPDVARLAGFLTKTLHGATAEAVEHGTASQYAHIFDHASGMPVSDPVPFNFTEAHLDNAVVQSMAAKWEDAFRLQYFAQNRSMFQRSINHPMFGLYPASYMWGKVGPELIKFMALEPFGMNTGVGLRMLADAQKSVTVQRQYDPEFDKAIEDLGTNPALSFLGYMLPATPWSVPASYPGWMRAMAEQGLKNSAAAESGGLVEDDDFIAPLTSIIKKTFPMSTTVPWAARALDELGGALPWNGEEPTAVPAGATDAMGAPVAQPAPDLSEPTSGVGVNVILADQMRSLQALFGS